MLGGLRPPGVGPWQDPQDEAGLAAPLSGGDGESDGGVVDVQIQDRIEGGPSTSVFEEVGFATVDIGSLREGGPLMQAPSGPLSALHVLKQD